jgi:group I intron endonuclease
VINSGIYIIYCFANDKLYIGSTNNFKRRISRHKLDLTKNIHENKYLQNSWNKYGSSYFDFFIVEFVKEFNLLEREIWWISQFDKLILFNLEPPGRPPVNKGEKHWLFNKGYLQSGSKNPMFGKVGSNKQKVSVKFALKGKIRKESEKRNMSIGRKNNKLSNLEVLAIRELLRNCVSCKELSILFNVSTATISNIKNRKIFKFVEELQ